MHYVCLCQYFSNFDFPHQGDLPSSRGRAVFAFSMKRATSLASIILPVVENKAVIIIFGYIWPPPVRALRPLPQRKGPNPPPSAVGEPKTTDNSSH